MKSISTIKNYHFHLYYNDSNIGYAKKLGELIAENFSARIGHFHTANVGPHPMWSCQILVDSNNFYQVYSYLVLNREDVSVFIHPDTNEDLIDHTKYISWLGKPISLNTAMFE